MAAPIARCWRHCVRQSHFPFAISQCFCCSRSYDTFSPRYNESTAFGSILTCISRLARTFAKYRPRQSGCQTPTNHTRCLSTSTEAATKCQKRVLGIETSCDDTGAAVVDDEGNVLGEALHSQTRVHLE